MATRLKSHWFRDEQPRAPAEVANALAAVVWRTADQRIRNLRKANFVIAADASYLNVLAELLAFLVVVADRVAYRHDPGPWRVEFTTALTVRVGELLQDSFDDLLGPIPGGYRKRFVDLLNRRADEYADHGYDAGGPDFGFLRHFGHAITEAMPDDDDRRWALDQAMTVEGPECAEVIGKAMRGLLGLEPKPRRAREGGE
jgi:hypothetical protein